MLGLRRTFSLWQSMSIRNRTFTERSPLSSDITYTKSSSSQNISISQRNSSSISEFSVRDFRFSRFSVDIFFIFIIDENRRLARSSEWVRASGKDTRLKKKCSRENTRKKYEKFFFFDVRSWSSEHSGAMTMTWTRLRMKNVVKKKRRKKLTF